MPQDKLAHYVRTHDWNGLALWLKGHPRSIGDPVMLGCLPRFALAGLGVTSYSLPPGLGADPVAEGFYASEEQHHGTADAKAARSQIERLLNAWAETALPGLRIRIEPTKARGAPTKTMGEEEAALLYTYRGLWDVLTRNPVRLLHAAHGPLEERVQRMARVILDLNAEYARLVDEVQASIIGESIAIPLEPLDGLAAGAIGRRALRRRPARRILLHELLAHHWRIRPQQVRGLIQKAEIRFDRRPLLYFRDEATGEIYPVEARMRALR